jgi:hypothetical protein
MFLPQAILLRGQLWLKLSTRSIFAREEKLNIHKQNRSPSNALHRITANFYRQLVKLTGIHAWHHIE